MPEELVPEEIQQQIAGNSLLPETEADMQAMLGVEDKVDRGSMTPEDLLGDVIANPDKYHPAMFPHLANFLVSNGLEKEVTAHVDIFQNPYIQTNNNLPATNGSSSSTDMGDQVVGEPTYGATRQNTEADLENSPSKRPERSAEDIIEALRDKNNNVKATAEDARL